MYHLSNTTPARQDKRALRRHSRQGKVYKALILKFYIMVKDYFKCLDLTPTP